MFDFPNPVNEVAARTVAAGVVLLAGATLVLALTAGTDWLWLDVLLAYGFLARVLNGPRFSPLGQLATRVVAPGLGHEKLVPGPPKRFAQGIGATLSIAALVLHALGADTAALVLVAMIVVAAGLESVLGYCLGCTAFGMLMRAGLIPEDTCVECADIWARTA